MKVTVCQIDANQLETDWQKLVRHTRSHNSDFVLLPEMSFSKWVAASDAVSEDRWNQAVAAHQAWAERLPELDAAIISGTMPVLDNHQRYNDAFIWTKETGVQFAHKKTYLPDELGFWEATWYERGPVDFQAVTVAGVTVGFMICTEMWFMQHAREYSQQGIHLLLCPRSTPLGTNDKWLVGGRTAGVVSGAYCLSSNHAGKAGDFVLGGAGWITGSEGEVLAVTTTEEPFITLEVDLKQAEQAKTGYPRYVIDDEL